MFLIDAIANLGGSLINAVSGHFERKHRIKEAVTQNKIRMAESDQTHNQSWEMASLENAGWKDDILFYGMIGMFVWSAINPEAAAKVFENWKALPEWFLQITGWLVASVLGVKKIGEYLPELISGVKSAVKGQGS
jgi:hypothetical protein